MIPAFIHGRHVVYRVYCENNSCLYVGCTVSLPSRLIEHKRNGTWYPLAARVVLTLHPDKFTALRVEREQIRTLRPRYNIWGRGPRSGWTPCDFSEVLETYMHTRPSNQGVHDPEAQAARIRGEFLARYPDIARQVIKALAS